VSAPTILSTKRTRLSQWVDLLEKIVQFGPGEPPQVYHCLTQAAYVGILVQTDDGRIPIVRQFRPCVEDYTWELPAGTLDHGESPDQAAGREVLEETGLVVTELHYLGNFFPDTGRLQVDSHAFFARARRRADTFSGTEGLSVKYVTHHELKQMMNAGEFRHQLHLAVYAAACAAGIALD
jgi:ADP-ribose pyrophosphatase